jgi:RNA polymerase sigma-70 factor (ECF subfamily)
MVMRPLFATRCADRQTNQFGGGDLQASVRMAHASLAEGATGRRAEGLMDRTVDSVVADLAVGAGEGELVRRAQVGDADAFDILVSGRVTTAYQTAWAILRDEADARDATQETFFQVWRDLPRLREPEKFDAWAGRILHNRCMSLLRRRRSNAVREVRVEDWDGAAYSSGRNHLADDHAESDAIRRAFARLTSEQRVLLAFHHVHGRSVAELATITGAPTGTVKWRLHHAREALERALESER